MKLVMKYGFVEAIIDVMVVHGIDADTYNTFYKYYLRCKNLEWQIFKRNMFT